MPSQNTSPGFIPHEPLVSQRGVREHGLGDLLFLLATMLLFASGALAVGTFLYSNYLEASANSKLTQLEKARAAIDPSLIVELTRLDDRMRAANEILSTHIAPSLLLKTLHDTTVQNISYSSLEFQNKDGVLSIAMDGVASAINTIAFQADLFARGNVITNPIFSGINRQLDGVHFALDATVNKDALLYGKRLTGTPLVPSGNTTPQSGFAPPTTSLPNASDGSSNVTRPTSGVPGSTGNELEELIPPEEFSPDLPQDLE
jgi:hypothetical protein